MDRRPGGLAELSKRVADLYRSNGTGGVLSGLRTRLLNDIFFRQFEWWQRRGIHVTPVSPWNPIPDTRELDGNVWNGSAELHGVDVCEDGQLSLLSTVREKYQEGYTAFPLTREEVTEPYQYFTRNGMFETVDGEMLYGIVRESDPDHIVQIGGGFSTRAIAAAVRDGSIDCRVEIFEPYRGEIREEDLPDACEFTGTWAEHADPATFERLESGDILFIDSAHVVRTGNHVSRLLFEILPQLPSGVMVHFHDIFLPYEYPKEWVLEKRIFLNEQYAVRSFLEFNDRFEVQWMGGYMHEHYPKRLASAFESYDPSRVSPNGEMDVPNSLWLKVTE